MSDTEDQKTLFERLPPLQLTVEQRRAMDGLALDLSPDLVHELREENRALKAENEALKAENKALKDENESLQEDLPEKYK